MSAPGPRPSRMDALEAELSRLRRRVADLERAQTVRHDPTWESQYRSAVAEGRRRAATTEGTSQQ